MADSIFLSMSNYVVYMFMISVLSYLSQMDIEGSEWAALNDLCESKEPLPFDQLIIELHNINETAMGIKHAYTCNLTCSSTTTFIHASHTLFFVGIYRTLDRMFGSSWPVPFFPGRKSASPGL